MMMQEFIVRTGFTPTFDEYKLIEEEYYKFKGDKDAFCRHFIKSGQIEKLINNRALKITALENILKQKEAAYKKEIQKLLAVIEKEQDWKPYCDEHNVRSSDYDRLLTDSCTQVLDDTEAKSLVCNWFGFDCDKVVILHSVPKYEVNRHRQLRKVGEIKRLPVYNATDWNYIRFDCANQSYEIWNGCLNFFWD